MISYFNDVFNKTVGMYHSCAIRDVSFNKTVGMQLHTYCAIHDVFNHDFCFCVDWFGLVRRKFLEYNV